ncbi:MAG: potassium channel family protein [Flammeovirgaceae bacterium]
MILFDTIIEFLRNKEYRDLLITTSIVLTIGTVSYHFLEGWSWLDSLYFSVITLTTVGYGDFSPQTDGGKIFTIIYIISGIAIILTFINTLYNHYNEMVNKIKK